MRNITITQDNRVHIEFEKSDGVYTFRDAIVLSKSQYDSMTETDIENIEQQRFDNFLSIVNAVPEVVENVDETIIDDNTENVEGIE